MPKCLALVMLLLKTLGKFANLGSFRLIQMCREVLTLLGIVLLLFPGAKYLGDVGQSIQNIWTIKTNPRYPFILMLTTINNNVLYS